MSNKVAKKHIADRQRLAKILMFAGIALVVISGAISAFFIQPTDFKQRFRQQQLEDCLATKTSIEECQKRFN